MKIEIDILNYNGADLLKMCLPSVLEAARFSAYKCRLVVVDNLSTDDSQRLVAEEFPEFEFYRTNENRVLCSFNDAAKESDADIMFFLNNDIRVNVDFIDPMVEPFLNDKGIFLVAAKCYNFDGTEIENSAFLPDFRWGVFKAVTEKKSQDIIDTFSYTFQDGCGAFDRKKFLGLNGYDEIYLPGRIEDSDLGFRAWKKGYKSYYQPKSIIYHMGMASFTRYFSMRRLLTLSHRNIFIFTWKNITDRTLLFKHILFIVPRFVYAFLSFKWEIIAGFFKALLVLPAILKRRKRAGGEFLLSDREVFRLFNK